MDPADHTGQPVPEMRVRIAILRVEPGPFGIVQDRADLPNRWPGNVHPVVYHNSRDRLLLTATLDACLGMIEFETFVFHDVSDPGEDVSD